MSGWSKIELDTKIDIKEEFCATLESIKSEEEERDVDIKPATLPQKYEVQGIEASSQCSEVTWRSNDDVSLSSRCRLCAIPYNNMVDIFSTLEVEDILEKIKYSLPITVTEMDTLPKQICRFCLEELERCYRFHKIVAEADKQLHAFDKLASIKLEKTNESFHSFPTYNAQNGSIEYDDIDGPLDPSRIIPGDARTADTSVKSNVSLESLRPCSVVSSIIESCCENSSDMGNGRERPRDTDHRNPVSTPETFDSGSIAMSEVNQQSARHSEKHLMNSVTHVPAHMSEQRYKCDKCAKTFEWKSHLIRHSVVHMEAQRHECNTCSKTFEWKIDLIRHSAVHMDERPHKCNTCAKTFEFKSELIQHRAVHIDERPHKCNTCVKTFKLKSHLTQHCKIHTNEGPVIHKCNICEKTFKLKSNLTRHCKIHTNKRLAIHKRDTCAKTFNRKDNLLQHSKIHTNEGLAIHKCNICAKTFNLKSNLTQHYKFHTNKGLYSCEYCGKKFISRGSRECHVRIHTNERPFKCPVCDRSFTTSSSMKHHLQVVHSDKRNYICPSCDKSFKSSKSRKLHMVVHASNRPVVQCDYCKNNFTLKSSLRVHLRTCKEQVKKISSQST